MLARGPLLQLWRAAVDNDGLKLWTGQETKPLGRWRKLGLDRLKVRCESLAWRQRRDGAVVVDIRHAASGRNRWSDAAHTVRYTVHPDGRLEVQNTVALDEPDMTDLPRIGVCLHLRPGFETLRWFGRGPWENYPDRKASAWVALHESTVSAQYVPYVMPQEHGQKTDVRWLELSDGRGLRLRVEGDPLLQFSASHFTADDLYAATHTTDLVPRAETILNLDAAHRGLGTGSCGPDTLPAYRLNARRCRWRYALSVQVGPR